MALSLPQRPVEGAEKVPVITNWTPIVPYTAKETDISGLFYFKFVLEIRLNNSSGTLLGKLKQRHNGYATGTSDVYTTFDLRNIVNTQLDHTYADQNSTTNSIHTLGANATDKIISKNSNQVVYIYVKLYRSFSDSATTVPTENTTGSVDNSKYYIAASLPLETPRTSGTYFQGTAFQKYQLNGILDHFLSDLQGTATSVSPTTHVLESDYHTLGFLNGEDTFNSVPEKFFIKYYNADDTQNGLTATIENSSITGGATPASGGEVNTNAERILYLGCGPANLEAYNDGGSNPQRPSNHSGWSYYVVIAFNTALNVQRSKIYKFVKLQNSCKGFKSRRLAWINSLGCYDYFTFNMKSTQSLEVKRNTYGKLIGDFNNTEYSYQNYESAKKVREVEATRVETLNTDYITEEDAQLLENLLMSTDVFMVENADTEYTIPVMVTDNKIVRKTKANNKVKIQYTIKIEYSNPINTNS